MEKLYRIKKHREDKKLRILQEMRSKLATAEMHVEEKKMELDHYHNWRVAKERELFAVVSGKAVSLREINHYTGKTMQFRDNELSIKQSLEDARKGCREAEEEEAGARQKYIEAMKARHKIEELNQMLMHEQCKMMERKAESELDDIPARRGLPGMRLNTI